MTNDRPDVDAIVATFPIDDFARISKIPPEQVRDIAWGAVRNAVDNGGYPHNVGKVMRYAIEEARR
jgi:hypothetical protein